MRKAWNFRKFLVSVVISCFFVVGASSVVFATEGEVKNTGSDGLLPSIEKGVSECQGLMGYVNINSSEIRNSLFKKRPADGIADGMGGAIKESDVLGCAIKTGDVKMWMIPYYIRYILEFALNLAGLVAIGGIVFGGYLYLFAGISDDKDQGKKAILYSVSGFIITLVAWAFVNLLVSFFTI